jgi:hypothetical protein
MSVLLVTGLVLSCSALVLVLVMMATAGRATARQSVSPEELAAAVMQRRVRSSESRLREAVWMVRVGDDARGPVTLEQVERGLAAGLVSADAELAQVGMSNWLPVTDVLAASQARERDFTSPEIAAQIEALSRSVAASPTNRGGVLAGRGRALAWVGIVGAGLIGLLLVRASENQSRGHEPTADEIAQREAQDQQQEAARQREVAAEMEKKQAADLERWKADKARRIAGFAKLTRGERRAEMARVCPTDGSDCDERADEIVAAGADDSERKALQAVVDKAQVARAVRRRKKYDEEDIFAREIFATVYRKQLLDAHLSPDVVSAAGPNKTTLAVGIWMCSRQFIYDVQTGTVGSTAKGLGFKRVQCTFGDMTVTADL